MRHETIYSLGLRLSNPSVLRLRPFIKIQKPNRFGNMSITIDISRCLMLVHYILRWSFLCLGNLSFARLHLYCLRSSGSRLVSREPSWTKRRFAMPVSFELGAFSRWHVKFWPPKTQRKSIIQTAADRFQMERTGSRIAIRFPTVSRFARSVPIIPWQLLSLEI